MRNFEAASTEDKLELSENLRRIELTKMLGNAGICDEYNGQVIKPCPLYAEDCPKTCTYARSLK